MAIRHAKRPYTGVLGRAEALGHAHEVLGIPPCSRDTLVAHFKKELEETDAPSIDHVVRVYDEARAWAALRKEETS